MKHQIKHLHLIKEALGSVWILHDRLFSLYFYKTDAQFTKSHKISNSENPRRDFKQKNRTRSYKWTKWSHQRTQMFRLKIFSHSFHTVHFTSVFLHIFFFLSLKQMCPNAYLKIVNEESSFEKYQADYVAFNFSMTELLSEWILFI